MLKPNLEKVCFSSEYGDPTLPPLKELASEYPDTHKAIILDYLRTNCSAACPGVVYDIITPGQVIGDGSLFTDGKYLWCDYLASYVDKYNIPLPEAFRTHILNTYASRKEQHLLLRCVDKVIIRNNPLVGYRYEACISRNGQILYKNNIDCSDGAFMLIRANDAEYIIDEIMTELFCYDEEDHGKPCIDGYNWEIQFFTKKDLAKAIEGWPGENAWRRDEFRMIIEFVERFIPNDLGAKYAQDWDDI